MTLLAATNKQVPEHSILDHFDKQTYLGNQYSVSQFFTVGRSEIPLMLLNNNQLGNSQTLKALFQNHIIASTTVATNDFIFNVYLNPTVTAGIQTVAFVDDSTGSLNNTYFLLNDAQGNGYYVWFNINSAGVDPAIAGKTGVEVAGATNANAATLGAAAKPLIIALNGGLSFSVSGTSTLTITNLVTGPFTPAIDGAVPTGFSFSVTGGPGSAIIPINLRTSYGNNSIAQISINPLPTSNGTLIESFIAAPSSLAESKILKILDNGQSLLVTSLPNDSVLINLILQWYEL